MKQLLLIFTTLLFLTPVYSQESTVYNWSLKDDALGMLGSGAFFGGSLYAVLATEGATEAEISALNPSDVFSFDRSAIDRPDDESLKGLSDVLLFTSVSLPFIHYAAADGRNEGMALAGMTLKAFFIADGVTNYFKGGVQRLRPFTYDPLIPLDEKLKADAKFSFISGHTSATALFSFLGAKFHHDLYPNSKYNKLVWVAAATIPAVTGYLRYSAGRHFPTDIIAGYLVGATTGILIPHFQKRKNKGTAFNIVPVQNGFVFTIQKTIK